jgi:hypothetical protein
MFYFFFFCEWNNILITQRSFEEDGRIPLPREAPFLLMAHGRRLGSVRKFEQGDGLFAQVE